jgi:hypothetical protein
LPLLGGRVLASDEKEEGHAHEPVKVEDLPAGVQDTFRTEANGGTVEELRKETRQGKVIYEGEIVKAGKGVDLEVGSDGKVIRRGKAHDENEEHERGEK